MSLEKIDVVMITKNSNSKIKGIFEKSLESLYRNVPINRLIVIDGGSTDNTKEVVLGYGCGFAPEIVWIDSPNDTRAIAREKGCHLAETPWFMFIDDDVILSEEWYEKAKKYMADDVGLIWGLSTPPAVGTFMNNVKTMAGLRMITVQDQLMKSFNYRGGTHDTLIRTSLVKNIKIPADNHMYEDAYLKMWIEARGFKALGITDAYCTHIKPRIVWTSELGYTVAMLELKYGFYHDKTGLCLFRNWLLAVPKAIMVYLRTGDSLAAREQITVYNVMFKGYLRAKYEGVKRVSINWETGETS